MRQQFPYGVRCVVLAGSLLTGCGLGQIAQGAAAPPNPAQPEGCAAEQAAQDAPAAQKADAATAASSEKPKDAPNSATPKKVYTNEDLTAMRGEPISVVGNSGARKKPPTNNATKNDRRDQTYWHNRAQNLRNQIAKVDAQIAQLNASLPQNSTTEGGADSTTGSNPIYLRGQGARLTNLKAQKAALEKQMDDLEEEARKAGVPPGWLR